MNNQVSVTTVLEDYSESVISVSEDDLTDDTANNELETEGSMKAQAWWTGNGCLPGGYQHCGGNCGYGLAHEAVNLLI
ncbi:hypothetical protein [Paenibacillus sp. NPDC055715]